ncbi:hypothetical protein D5R40_33070 [Okeania hirsuta]|uniref:Uncharacterized protein n=1 Tax=Okeania hirsuta TaxID=1458930 RepID=A0A3N6QR60_9CYAN|nr:hypothetical protein D5R40_33070 [Okeania hirsuta]
MNPQKSPKVDPPFRQPTWQEIEPEEIEVTDPTHPLFGARFSLISISNPPIGEAHAFVQYRDYMILKIPISATELGVSTPSLSTKLSLSSLKAIIKLFKDCKELCHIDLLKSTKTSARNSKTKSGKNS